MELRNILIIVALALYALAMGGIVSTEAYSQAAGAEARGVHALLAEVRSASSIEPMLANAPRAVSR
jgi:flagellar basal body-associated protein FliL